ncbi:hypothetical protein D3C87_841140 [compost metagenome]
MDHVVAVPPLDHVVATDIGNNVVAGAGLDHVVAESTLDPIVAAVAPDRVVTLAGNECIVAFGTAQHDVLVTVVLQVIVGAVFVRGGRRIVTDHQRNKWVVPGWVIVAKAFVELPHLIRLERQAGGLEYEAGQVIDVCILGDQLGEGVCFKLGQEVRSRKPVQVVQAVAVLQGLELGLEHEIES